MVPTRVRPAPRPGLLLLLLGTTACALDSAPQAPESEGADGKADSFASAALKFDADWTEGVDGELLAGSPLTIEYATERLRCTGTRNGQPAWTLVMHARMNGGEVTSGVVLGHAPSEGARMETWTPPEAGELEIWFENTSAFGCHAWDSDHGKNYRFAVRGRGPTPDALGAAAVVIARAECEGLPCEADRQDATEGFLYDSWARERAAVAAAFFDVRLAGVTDAESFEPSTLLRAAVHTRFGEDTAPEVWPLDTVSPAGSHARYRFDLRMLDPFAGPAPTRAEECPEVPLEVVSATAVRARVTYHFTVNDYPLRASAGTPFRGTFEAPRDAYSACLGTP